MIIVELILLFLVFMATIAVVQAVRKVPVQYAKRIIGNKQYGGVRQYIPLKMNAANVMPIIFAQALMFIPMLFANVAPKFAGAFANVIDPTPHLTSASATAPPTPPMPKSRMLAF